MKKDFSPEEKLLRLIRGSGKKTPPREKEEEPAPKMQPYESSAPQLTRAPASRDEAMPLPPKAARPISLSLPVKLKEINTRTLNSVLIIVLVCLLSYFIFDLYYTTFYKKPKIDVFPGDEKEAPKVKKGNTVEMQPYSFYSSSIEGRNIFMPQQLETEPVVTGPGIDEIRTNLSLIGIIAGEKPQAIIEDRKTGKSHFLYEGGVIGDIKVVDILEDVVIMDYKGQRFELVL